MIVMAVPGVVVSYTAGRPFDVLCRLFNGGARHIDLGCSRDGCADWCWLCVCFGPGYGVLASQTSIIGCLNRSYRMWAGSAVRLVDWNFQLELHALNGLQRGFLVLFQHDASAGASACLGRSFFKQIGQQIVWVLRLAINGRWRLV
jgi:hypothetical protein